MIMTCRGWDWGKCCRRVNIVSPGAAATAEKMVEALGKLWGSLISSSFIFFSFSFRIIDLNTHISIDARLTHSPNVDTTRRWVTWLAESGGGYLVIASRVVWPDAWHSYASTSPTQLKLKSRGWTEEVTLTDSIQCNELFVIYTMNDGDPHDNDRFGSIDKILCKQFPWK